MKLLIVAMSESIHTARWLAQIADQGWDIHLFPSIDYGVVHPEIYNVTVHHSFFDRVGSKGSKSVKFKGCQLYFRSIAPLARRVLNKFFPEYRKFQLKRLIKRLNPDVIHSHEIQQAGYLTLKVKQEYRAGKFPPWVVTVWGSDLFLFGRLKDHEQKIRNVLEKADYFSCECNRDVDLAKKYGFAGDILMPLPVTGGYDFEEISSFKERGKISARRLIMLKGYQSWAGRALVGLRALERCADILTGYEVVIYSGDTTEMAIAAELFFKSTGIPTTIIPRKTRHEEIMKLHGKARVSIGLSISDGISVSFLEAIVMGSFPIQSWTACANEWIEDGKAGILVHPEDPEVIEAAIRLALTNDNLVDQAAEENLHTCQERLGYDFLKTKAIELYLTVSQEKGIQNDN